MRSVVTGSGAEPPALNPADPTYALRSSPGRLLSLDGHVSASPESRTSLAPPPAPASPYSLSLDGRRPILAPFQEYHSGYSDDAGTPPPSHRRQQSFPILLPPSLGRRTPSPTRRTARFSAQMPLTGDGRGGRAESPRRTLAGWFGGPSASNTPSANQRSRASSRDATPEGTPTNLRPRAAVVATASEISPTKSTVSATASRFLSAFSRFTQGPASPTMDDELCSLNIEAALFPQGAPQDGEPFSPAAFKNLQLNAIGLLARMQTAYRERVMVVRELEAEKGAQVDELEEAETRAQHLKMQLEDMARKAQEHEKAMERLVEELAAERKARAEERLGRTKGPGVITDGSTVSEDLGVDEDDMRRKWRKSAGTVKSDASFDTDEESAESESVFSRSRSPTIPPITFDGASIDGSASQFKGRSLAAPRAKGEPPLSTFQKMIKGISRDAEEGGLETCRNCKGQDAGVAWDTVSLLREENKHLKQRVGELEVAVEGALDLVNGVGL